MHTFQSTSVIFFSAFIFCHFQMLNTYILSWHTQKQWGGTISNIFHSIFFCRKSLLSALEKVSRLHVNVVVILWGKIKHARRSILWRKGIISSGIKHCGVMVASPCCPWPDACSLGMLGLLSFKKSKMEQPYIFNIKVEWGILDRSQALNQWIHFLLCYSGRI